jgi:hypothetical protein
MKVCPNCGRATSRTRDWACQWCGFPLISTSYGKVEKTFRELKEEKRLERLPAGGGGELPPATVPEPEPVAEIKPEPEPEPEPVAEIKPEPEPEPEPVAEIKPEPEPEPEPVAEAKPELEPEPEPELVAETKPEPEPEPVAETETQSTAVELSVEELYSTLEADRAAAEAKYQNRVLKVTGLVYRTVINDNLDVAILIIASAKNYSEWQVSCTFDRKREQNLNRLTEGETVTVQGRYDGYGATVLMRDCAIVR